MMRRSITAMLALCGLVSTLGACAPRYDGFQCDVLNETPTQNLCTDQRIEGLARERPGQIVGRQDPRDAAVEARTITMYDGRSHCA